MVIRGGTRGNGRQLGHYLLAKKDNEAIRILDVNGRLNADDKSVHDALYSMNITSELTKSDKGLYHAQINPAIGEDRLMTDASWLKAAGILAKELGYENQRQVIVLHTKKGRTHAHVVWERYDKEKSKMIPNDFSRYAQDRARKEMELTLNQKATPHRNRHRPELKASISQLWNQTGTGAQFVKAARDHDYIIAQGSGRRPYMVVDKHGRSFDLVRQLNGVKTKDVKERLHREKLMGEKDAIAYMQKEAGRVKAAQEKMDAELRESLKKKHDALNEKFAENQSKIKNSDSKIDPRREAFRKQMDETNEQNRRDKSKDRGPEPEN